MIRQKLYSYIGYNGSVTTPILLPLEHQELIKLIASDGYILTNGVCKQHSVLVLPENESNWTEEEFWGTIE